MLCGLGLGTRFATSLRLLHRVLVEVPADRDAPHRLAEHGDGDGLHGLAGLALEDLQDPARRDYPLAFRQAVARMGAWKEVASERKPAKHMARNAVDMICLLKRDGEDEFPDMPKTANCRGWFTPSSPAGRAQSSKDDESGEFH